MAWSFVAVALVAGLAFFIAAAMRARSIRPVGEAAPGSSVAELTTGRFRLVGRVVPIQTTPSSIDASPCVFVERAVYRTVGSELVPLLRQVDHFVRAHPFYLDDGTGRVRVDPREAVIDAVTLVEDEGLLAERRLRVGEELELVATFEPCESEVDGGPYRGTARGWQAVGDPTGPPRLGHVATYSTILTTDDTTLLLRGFGAVLIAAALLLTATAALL
jgi:hypothetical protein